MLLLVIIYLLQMSKYKTPFPASIQISKELQDRTAKYKLPFQKDSPVQKIQLTLNNIQPNNIVLNSSTKLPKIEPSSEANRKHLKGKLKTNLSIHEEVHMQVPSQKQQMTENQIANAYVSHNLNASYYQLKPLVKPKWQLYKPSLLSHSNKKRQYLSNSSKYQQKSHRDQKQLSDQEYAADVSQKNQQEQLVHIEQSKIYEIIKRQDDYIKIYETLSKDIQHYQQNKQKWSTQKRKISSRNKHIQDNLKIKINTDLPYLDDQIKKLPKNHTEKRSTNMNQFPSLYADLGKNQQQQQKSMKKTLSLFNRLNQIASIKKSKLKQNKTKMPLQFYLASYGQIKSINPFFRKLSPMEGCILLNIGKLAIFEGGRMIYNQGGMSKEIFVIIYGKILLSNNYKTLRKFALTGQTLGQEQLFENEKTYVQRLKQAFKPAYYKYDAKALNKTCILRIQLVKYYRMSCELNRMGYKQQFNLIDNLFRINYLNKQTNLHQKQRYRVATQASLRKKPSEQGSFIY